MEKVKDSNILETFENDIEFYLHEFIEVQNIEDMKKESQNVWNSCLMYIKRKVFPNNKILKDNTLVINDNINTTYNRYNYSLLDSISDYYIYLCGLYDKEVSIMGFSILCGIDKDTIISWSGDTLNPMRMGIYKKLSYFHELSLQSMLTSGKRNPVGTLSILNHFFGWNSIYTPPQNTKQANISDIKERYNVELIADVVQVDETKQENP